MQEMKRHAYALKSSQFMGISSNHKHSKSCSFPDYNRVEEDNNVEISSKGVKSLKLDMEQVKDEGEPKKKQSPNLQTSLKKEIKQLEKQLGDQFVLREGLEQALSYRPLSDANSYENSIPKPSSELIKEIAVLELEVAYLEKYLLSLYRSAFDKITLISPATTSKTVESHSRTKNESFLEDERFHILTKTEDTAQFSDQLVFQDSQVTPRTDLQTIMTMEKLLDVGIHRSDSTLSQRSTFSNRTPRTENVDRSVWSFHSQPLPFMEESDTPRMISLAEHLGTRVADHIPETPNKISEDIIKCMAAIYCKLSDPPLVNHGRSSSPTSFTSSMSEFSPQAQYDVWSPRYRNGSSFDENVDNPFHMEGSNEFSGTYTTMVEVPSICRDSHSLHSVDDMLKHFRSLVGKLEEVDVRKLKHKDKLAFWINIHNALVMHAFLAYGIPQNSIKRVSLFLKAAYNVGGHTISVNTIQSSILGCRMPRPGQWLRMLFSSPKTKLKDSNDRHAYAIDHHEPLIHFALCAGSYSDPVVRVFTPKRVIQELDTAKEEYIQATLTLDPHKEQKICLPKIVESFAKETSLSPIDVAEMIQQFMPESFWKRTHERYERKSNKSIEWVPHNFSFRYLISKELVK